LYKKAALPIEKFALQLKPTVSMSGFKEGNAAEIKCRKYSHWK